MSQLLFRLEDHFYFLAERNPGALASVLYRPLSAVFAVLGDVLHASTGRVRHY